MLNMVRAPNPVCCYYDREVLAANTASTGDGILTRCLPAAVDLLGFQVLVRCNDEGVAELGSRPAGVYSSRQAGPAILTR